MNISDLKAFAPVFAATAAVAVVILVFLPKLNNAKLEKRKQYVRDRRATLRNLNKISDKKGEMNASSMVMMRKAVEKFRMEDLLENEGLKMKMAQAGLRGRRPMTIYLFSRMLLPPLGAIFAYLYMLMIAAPGEFNPLRAGAVAIAIALTAYFAPNIYLSNIKSKRQKEMMRAYPDLLDLMVICVEAGMSIEMAFNRVADEISAQSIALAEEVSLTTAELSYIGDRRMAYNNFARRTDMKQVKAITSALVQAERYGTPVATALRVIAAESRDDRMSRAEQKAAALPSKLTVPMILFFLPVLFVVIIGPVVIKIMNM